MQHSYDPDIDAWYFTEDKEDGNDPLVVRTEELGERIVNLDYDAAGNIIGVEIL